MRYVHPDSKELSMVFDFDMVKLGGHDDPDNVKAHQVKHLCDGDPSFTLPLFKQRLKKVQDLIASGAWGTVFMEK
jgi:alpha-glucosidase